MRGYLNENYPSADRTYDEAMAEIRKEYQKPVFSFEVGQFEVLPDFEELESFHGISDPVNLKLIKTCRGTGTFAHMGKIRGSHRRTVEAGIPGRD